MKKLIFIAVMAIFLTSCNGYQLDVLLKTESNEGQTSVVSRKVNLGKDSTYFIYKDSESDLHVGQLKESGDTIHLHTFDFDVKSYEIQNLVLSYYDCQNGSRILNEKTPSFEETEVIIDSLLNQIEESKY